MWYFTWILGTLLACSLGIITALALEQSEATKAKAAEDNAQ
ncbi:MULTISPECIES: cytochrome bd-I oxidase subunit CydX [Symbiopectobacterium]|nr:MULTISPECIES: cytochrome bd-I oxidase subunit CydX [Symbiopectobacterium]MBG6247580.1 cytochrome bd-I oxidase subunit CydX [Candidatus Symbiopectobacterium sp. PLON1]MBT9429698.1 cytochrome bd-I oxidase subunit CydX [Candidatus Symbiopectobacterium endolongispinus]